MAGQSQQFAVRSYAVLRVIDFMGKEIRTLVDADMTHGEHQLTFDASGLPAGVYFSKLQADGLLEVGKMVKEK